MRLSGIALRNNYGSIELQQDLVEQYPYEKLPDPFA